MNKILAFLFCVQFWLANADENYRYELAIGAIFRDEAPYLKEWIEFHKLVGVQHFYLFNHCSEDEYLFVLQEYIDRGEVELFEWPYHAHSWENWLYEVQAKAYENCILQAEGKVKWLALIDIDEFLVPNGGKDVPSILKDYEEFGGVGFNWKIFGNSGLLDLPTDKLLIEALIMRAPDDRPTHLGVKSIVRPERVKGCQHPHYVVYKDGYYHVNSNKQRDIDSQGVANGVYYNRLAIHHYWSRSGNYLYKKLKRWSAFVPHVVPENWPQYVESMNIQRDYSMDRFILPLREKMGL